MTENKKQFFLIRWIKTLIRLYIEAFKYRLAKRLFLIIAIKMFIMFAILKAFFFKDYLDENFETEEEKSAYVLKNLTQMPVEQTQDNQHKNH